MPPAALVAGGHLYPFYNSLESLCEALRCLDGDLQTPPSASSRRCKKELNVTPTQLLALRLRIAEGLAGLEKEETSSPSESDSLASEEETVKKRKRKKVQDISNELPHKYQEIATFSTPPDAITE